MNEQASEHLLLSLRELARRLDFVDHLPERAARHLPRLDDREILRLTVDLLVRVLDPIREGFDVIMLHPDDTPDMLTMSTEDAELLQALLIFGRCEDSEAVVRIRDTLIKGLGGADGEFVGILFDRLMLILGLVTDEGYALKLIWRSEHTIQA